MSDFDLRDFTQLNSVTLSQFLKMSSSSLNVILTKVHDALAYGALSKGWGGIECFKAIPLRTHIVESSFWIGLCIATYYGLNVPKHYKAMTDNIKLDLAQSKIHPVARALEIIVGSIHMFLCLQLVYYKSNISSLINLLQPCHVICLLQGLALLSTDTFGVLVAVFVLPALTGTTAAMLFPETDGLDQPFEMQAYWIQHYFIEAVPLYLLLRRGSLALKYSNIYTMLGGLWILAVLHFSLYEVSIFIFS